MEKYIRGTSGEGCGGASCAVLRFSGLRDLGEEERKGKECENLMIFGR